MKALWKRFLAAEDRPQVLAMDTCDVFTFMTIGDCSVEYIRGKGTTTYTCPHCGKSGKEYVGGRHEQNTSMGDIASSSAPVFEACPACFLEIGHKLAALAGYFVGGEMENHILEAPRRDIGNIDTDDGDEPDYPVDEFWDEYIAREKSIADNIAADRAKLDACYVNINAYDADPPVVYILTYESDIGERQTMAVYGTLERAIYNMHLLRLKLDREKIFKDANITVTMMKLNRPIDLPNSSDWKDDVG